MLLFALAGCRVFLESRFRSVELPDTFLLIRFQMKNAGLAAFKFREDRSPEAREVFLVPGCECRLLEL